MAELILQGVYNEVRTEALIVCGPINVDNIGIVGTAAGGEVDKMEILSSYADALEKFGPYDAFDAAASPPSLTLVRALQIAYDNGANTVLAVRVAKGAVSSATIPLGNAAVLTARLPGTFGNPAKVKVEVSPTDATKQKVTLSFKNLAEIYEVATGTELVNAINSGSTIATAKEGTSPTDKPADLAETSFTAGANGAAATPADYKRALDVLLNEDAHIIVAAGLDETVIGDELKAHVEEASNDKVKRDRIAFSGSAA